MAGEKFQYVQPLAERVAAAFFNPERCLASWVVAPNPALHLAEPHCPRVAFASISRGLP